MASKKNRWQSCVTVVVFCLLIFGFTAATIATPSSEFSETENRVLAGMPDVKIKTLLSGDFEAAYEEYLTDQFGKPLLPFMRIRRGQKNRDMLYRSSKIIKFKR